jgi:trigger factor
VSDAASLEDLRARIRQGLERRRALAAREERLNVALDALVDQAELEYPAEMVDSEVDGSLADLRQRVERQGFGWERWLELQGRTEEELREQVAPEAQRRVQNTLVLSELALAEGIRIQRADIEDEIRRRNTALAPAGLQLKRNAAVRRSTANDLAMERILERLLAIVSQDDPAPIPGEPDPEPEPAPRP